MTNRLDASGYDTDKALHTHYLRSYEQYFDKLQDREVRLLELGVYKGGSLLLWRDYFQKGLIVGLDLNPIQLDDPSGRIRTYSGQQQDTNLLDRIGAEAAPGGFDVIIDDCSHIGELTRISFWHLFDNHLKAGGLYVIEDWSTGYWDSWFDGVGFRTRADLIYSPSLFRLRSAVARLYRSGFAHRVPLAQKLFVGIKRVINGRQFHSHDHGLVGFIKELVDECGMADITRRDLGKPPERPSKFKEMRISPGQVFIVKA
ncbi:MAG: class I SAM-dependent methyltransferase [Pyrinomonadaceae bacterium]|nr:class I SAM-dependent methyltransferase [Pyrinomonadaceae bacterium]